MDHMETAALVQQPTTEPIPNRTPPEANKLMKFHACLNVSNLGRSLDFYSALLGCAPVKAYEDYAKFEIDVPPLILSLKPKRACVGGPLNHLGLRVTSPEQLNAIHERMKAVGARIGRQNDVACCYAWQSKLWITDPDETLWEVYQFHDDAPDWGEKQNLVKLWKAPLQAFGVKGVVKRFWANKFFKRGAVHHPEMGQQGENTTESLPGNDSCKVREEEQR